MLKAKIKIINSILSAILAISLVAASLTACGKKNDEENQDGQNDQVAKGEKGDTGAPGRDGADGETPYIGRNGHWWIGMIDTGVLAHAVDGKNGTDGKDGVTPIFSYDSATNMLTITYGDGLTSTVTIDLAAICQAGVDGVDGKDGKDGVDGKDGENGISPILSINQVTNYWMVSYDNGATWTSLNVKATGEKGDPGKDGANGKDGKNGVNGTNGTNGADGKDGADGATPLVRINPYTYNWEVSYDDGYTWDDLGVCALGSKGYDGTDGTNGKDGKDGKDGETPEIYVENGKLYVKYPSRDSTFVYDFSSATEGKDGVTPELRINTHTYMWEVSYDNGYTWEELGVSAVGKNGKDGEDGEAGAPGKDGAQGEDGLTPHLYVEDDVLYVYYDNINEKEPVYDFSTLSVGNGGATGGTNGKDGITPQLKISSGYWQVSYDNGRTWTNLGVKATGENGKDGEDGAPGKNGEDGEDGKDGKDGRGISKVVMSDGFLIVTYTDGAVEVVGEIGAVNNGGSGSSSSNSGTIDTSNVYADALDFYPLNNGEEYGVMIGRATYMSRIEIPAVYRGKPVTTILPSGFTGGNNYLLELVLPETITTICENAFYGCDKIAKLSLPKSVKIIEDFAFSGVQCVELYASVENVSLAALSEVATVIVKGADKLPAAWPEFDDGVVVIYKKD